MLSDTYETLTIEFTDCEVELFYDQVNLEKYRKKYEQNYEMIRKILEKLCKNGFKERIYIRLHGYKEWLIIRLMGEWNLSEWEIVQIKKKCLEFNPEILFTFSCKNHSFYINISF